MRGRGKWVGAPDHDAFGIAGCAWIESVNTTAKHVVERDLASQLIWTLTSESFEPEKYEDSYRQSVLEVVDRKVAGEETVLVSEPESREQIIDLVAALKQSLSEKRGEDGSERKAAKAKGQGKQRKSATG